MNIASCILEALKTHGSVAVPHFGVFSLKYSGAIISNEDGHILPPAKQIVLEKNYLLKENSFVNFVAQIKGISSQTADFEIKTQIDYWKKKIEAGESFEVEALGAFNSDAQGFSFIGQRLYLDSPDVYGLEAINLSEMSSKKETQPSQPKKSNAWKVVLWLLIFIIPAGILGYLNFYHPEILFGVKSFEKDKTQKTTTPQPVKTTKTNDTLVIDSLKQDSLPANNLK
ncbi:hypothetical protein [Riemerella anatipestifer]|uniref:HU domain-containing protein n=1 Tax=Riemerella anatipestifer TaxID=34085 RepID=UPI00129E8603|nr:hypothetical protein [Riemerella anatipestifer]MRM83288.1 hypothetical protein [Riemerella anatipestifer]